MIGGVTCITINSSFTSTPLEVNTNIHSDNVSSFYIKINRKRGMCCNIECAENSVYNFLGKN